MNELKPLAVFAETVAAGSMSAAARRLGMSPSAVSQTIRALELQGGVTLLHRSTRRLALTEAGERYYPHCKRLLEAAQAAAESLQQARNILTGELRVSAPVGFASHVTAALAPLLAEATQLHLRLLVDDAMIDLVDARIDVALRIGRLADSHWVARRLCDLELILCASPDYLARHGTPTNPQDLAKHQWLAFWREDMAGATSTAASDSALAPGWARATTTASSAAASSNVSFSFSLHAADGQSHNVLAQARICSNNQLALQHMCEQGLGIARLARSEVLPLLQRGALVQVLPPWRHVAMPVWGVTLTRDAETAKARTALDYLKRYFAGLPHAAT